MIYTLESMHESYNTWWELENVEYTLEKVLDRAIDKGLFQFRVRKWECGIVVQERQYEGERLVSHWRLDDNNEKVYEK
ncbi:hypothetical protein [Bacillus phage SPO1L5]|nr:hypothetical protein [Bacillus phage SPO1L5]